MSVYISNAAYLALPIKNRPIIGWHSHADRNDFSTEDSQSAHPISNVWSPDTFTGWRSTTNVSASTITRHVEASTGTVDVNYVFIVGHNLADINATYTVQHSPDASAWTNASDPQTPTTNDPILDYFDTIEDTFWRIKMEAPGQSPSGIEFRIKHIRIGEALVLERPMFVGQKPDDKRVQKISNRSDSGRYLGQTVVSTVRTYNIQQSNNSGSFSRTYAQPFLDHCNSIEPDSKGPGGSFVFAWRPEEFPDDVLYCHAPSSINYPEKQRGNDSIGNQWSISGEAER